jgi:hypothetical protein
MTQNILKLSLPLLIAAGLFCSCQKDKMGEGNDEELITTMNLIFTPAGGGAPISFSFNDPDGAGGVAPAKDTILLNHSSSYMVRVELLNSTENPPVNITDEVQEESEAHRFYFETTGGVTVTGLNTDANSLPLGITSNWATAATGTGTAKVTLRHYIGTPPDKQATDPVNSPKSSTDIEIVFGVKIL